MLCDESLEDYEKKKSFLNQLGLLSTIKEEKSCESIKKYEHFKISLDEIIIIEDENDDSENVCIDENVKLLSKKQFLKVSQLKNQTKGTRAKSKKLLMLDFSSPLGQKIDFSMSISKTESSKSSLLKSPVDYINSYEKWCLTNSKVKYNVIKTKFKMCKNASSNLSKAILCEYNFRKRQKSNRNVKLSEKAKMLQRAMKKCFVHIPRIQDPQLCVPIPQLSISSCDATITSSSNCNISNSFVGLTDCATDANRVQQESSVSVCSETSPLADDTSILKNGLHLSEDCQVLIREVYSLAPGASPELPSHLVEMGQNLLNSCSILKVPGEHSATITSSCLSLSDYLAGSAEVVSKETRMENLKKSNGSNDCIIDLCGVDNDDVNLGDLNSDNRLLDNHALNDKVSQTHETASSQLVPSTNNLLNLLEFSFLCRICNQVVKCHGSYQTDMRDHYKFHHNITNVNLVPCEENGKTVWKLIETSASNPVESQTSRCQKRQKDDIPRPTFFLQNSAGHAVQSPSTFLPRFALNLNQSASLNSNQPTSFINSRTYASINNPISRKLFTPSDVICID